MLRALIDAILVFPGERRGKVSVTLRGDLAAFLRSDASEARSAATGNKKAALQMRSGVGREML